MDRAPVDTTRSRVPFDQGNDDTQMEKEARAQEEWNIVELRQRFLEDQAKRERQREQSDITRQEVLANLEEEAMSIQNHNTEVARLQLASRISRVIADYRVEIGKYISPGVYNGHVVQPVLGGIARTFK